MHSDQHLRELIYLASPYSDPDPQVREARYLAVIECAAHFRKAGRQMFCPIGHDHESAVLGLLPLESGFYADFNETMLERSQELWILALDGWLESEGIRREREFAQAAGLIERIVEPYTAGGYLIR